MPLSYRGTGDLACADSRTDARGITPRIIAATGRPDRNPHCRGRQAGREGDGRRSRRHRLDGSLRGRAQGDGPALHLPRGEGAHRACLPHPARIPARHRRGHALLSVPLHGILQHQRGLRPDGPARAFVLPRGPWLRGRGVSQYRRADGALGHHRQLRRVTGLRPAYPLFRARGPGSPCAGRDVSVPHCGLHLRPGGDRLQQALPHARVRPQAEVRVCADRRAAGARPSL